VTPARTTNITARDLAEELAATPWDDPDERPQSWQAFGEDATPNPQDRGTESTR
jgi:hypothetical protein